MKGIFSIGLVMVCVGSIIWLIRSNEVVKQPPATAVDIEQPVAASAQKQQVSSLMELGKTGVPESPRHRTGEIERHQAEETSLAHLKKAVSAQEEKVKERRKVLATIVRTKGIIYLGSGDDHSDRVETDEEAFKKSLDAQDYVDAKRDFETDQQLLQEMKLKLITEQVEAKDVGK